ncbi:N-acetyltransferase [Robertmurraya yapensis]|uniref:N-acetyltransferase n=1 Tax=Bacillus yapensis TaxID=2492960 RepID=A0A3S0IJN7_9BACI|nr:GNAT family N-acetyltransferase [Bacillus yapensis]RTR33993.1 N-acetyltransferase [Bacillus yapensis]TKS97311.1 GNAT family N-acetyltransferase [Bacillus yapensis]
MRIDYLPFTYNDSDMAQIAELYCRMFLDEQENVLQNINKHACYEGFKGLKAKNLEGEIVGFAYGYTSSAEQFYHQKMVKHFSEDEVGTWLSDCFEFVELAVRPDYQRRSTASQLHDLLLENNIQRTSVLTTGIRNEAAIHFYEKKGWERIKDNVPVLSESNLQVIMGKNI